MRRDFPRAGIRSRCRGCSSWKKLEEFRECFIPSSSPKPGLNLSDPSGMWISVESFEPNHSLGRLVPTPLDAPGPGGQILLQPCIWDLEIPKPGR
ncbi:hypothetical protein DV515_00016025 [Chloebia gouldiae]|uniref:Uncharacterized protein n=1 Tax=Chloebia gouldiae TaxID=44316 RepID=A0A3L8RTN5_CHLGU|nr:hypothetical protein DV515_00016025 [Chloebia gouldiae]